MLTREAGGWKLAQKKRQKVKHKVRGKDHGNREKQLSLTSSTLYPLGSYQVTFLSFKFRGE